MRHNRNRDIGYNFLENYGHFQRKSIQIIFNLVSHREIIILFTYKDLRFLVYVYVVWCLVWLSYVFLIRMSTQQVVNLKDNPMILHVDRIHGLLFKYIVSSTLLLEIWATIGILIPPDDALLSVSLILMWWKKLTDRLQKLYVLTIYNWKAHFALQLFSLIRWKVSW